MNKILKKLIFFAANALLWTIIISGVLYLKISNLQYAPAAQNYEPDIEKIVIESGDMLALTFDKTRLSKEDSLQILKELGKNLNVNRCRPGDFYEILYLPDGSWKAFWYYPSGQEFISIKKSPDSALTSSKAKLAVIISQKQASGTIESSLWDAMSEQSAPPDIIMSFADAFAWQIDFLTDTRQGDEFKIIYETQETAKKGEKILSRIIAAQYKTSSKTYNAFYYKTSGAGAGYFDEEGRSVKSAFLKAPLQFTRISSHFTKARKHPILKYVRPHLGIDYAAPSGTPVSAIGDGIVTISQYSGQNGNLVKIKHSNGYESSYGHLSKYGRGIKKGVRITQGQIIGYVGMTGLATGPHLDFRIKKDGKFFNYLTMKQPPTTKLSGKDKQDFLETIKAFGLFFGLPQEETNNISSK
ncbi:MAG: peptidoglycan DD-metalloendopeptidase family protein [Endomicrobium sp.]|jgi:murein DD-endopeptidase MepM/ murein hydrolase activator NlpD|nr:peptidoglycan DD-metalloendopeptidase family protein [Endomicrobium sp.]